MKPMFRHQMQLVPDLHSEDTSWKRGSGAGLSHLNLTNVLHLLIGQITSIHFLNPLLLCRVVEATCTDTR